MCASCTPGGSARQPADVRYVALGEPAVAAQTAGEAWRVLVFWRVTVACGLVATILADGSHLVLALGCAASQPDLSSLMFAGYVALPQAKVIES